MARNSSLQSGDPILIENRILDLQGGIADARVIIKEKNWHVKMSNLRRSLKSMREELDSLQLLVGGVDADAY